MQPNDPFHEYGDLVKDCRILLFEVKDLFEAGVYPKYLMCRLVLSNGRPSIFNYNSYYFGKLFTDMLSTNK